MILQLKSSLDTVPRFEKKFPSEQSIELFHSFPRRTARDFELFPDSADFDDGVIPIAKRRTSHVKPQKFLGLILA
jgi:hypothetical protein